MSLRSLKFDASTDTGNECLGVADQILKYAYQVTQGFVYLRVIGLRLGRQDSEGVQPACDILQSRTLQFSATAHGLSKYFQRRFYRLATFR